MITSGSFSRSHIICGKVHAGLTEFTELSLSSSEQFSFKNLVCAPLLASDQWMNLRRGLSSAPQSTAMCVAASMASADIALPSIPAFSMHALIFTMTASKRSSASCSSQPGFGEYAGYSREAVASTLPCESISVALEDDPPRSTPKSSFSAIIAPPYQQSPSRIS